MTLAPVEIPRDERPHPDHAMEWWYFVGHLHPVGEPDHPGYTIGFIVLRAEIYLQGAIGLVLFVDHERGVAPFRQATQLLGNVYRPLGNTGYRFAFGSGPDTEWTVEASQDLHYRLRLRRGPRFAIDLNLRAGAPHLLGEDGIVDYHQDVRLAYYTRPRLRTRGRLLLDDGRGVDVEGNMWLERQWGDADYTAARWKYLLLYVSDDEQWIFFRLDHKVGPRLRKRFGCRMGGGGLESIPEDSIEIDDVPNGELLPVETRVRVASLGIDLRVVPHFGVAQYYRPAFAPEFFEGASHVQGTIGGRDVKCWGMTEMAGYGGGA